MSDECFNSSLNSLVLFRGGVHMLAFTTPRFLLFVLPLVVLHALNLYQQLYSEIWWSWTIKLQFV